ncbi:MAG: PQQ-like beta-propeller repeat protein [Planctomycetota bacterium]|nr:PQQ-like beta-propeller repeat protein [Planctomycetota bacterium]MDA1137475.1 PQQ-like beta-propeller repeat protein [Planctomycetota bacterium]
MFHWILMFSCLLSWDVSHAADWPCWLGPNHDGISLETNLASEFPGGRPKEVWRTRIGPGFSGIAVVGNRLITMAAENGREKVLCFNVGNGNREWESDSDAIFEESSGNGPRGTPAVVGNRVYSHGAMGLVMCVELETGRPFWRVNMRDLVGAEVPEWGLSSSPFVDGNRLFLISGGKGACAVALDTRTGQLLWRAVDGEPSYSSPSLGTAGGWKQLVILTRKSAVGLAPETGRQLWEHSLNDDHNIPTPIWSPDGKLFLASNREGQLLNISGGLGKTRVEEVYGQGWLSNSKSTSVLHGGYLYGYFGSRGLACVELNSGRELWKERDPASGTLILAGGNIITLSEQGNLLIAPASPNGFEPVAELQVLSGTCWTVPSPANGHLYLRNKSELVSLDLRGAGTAAATEDATAPADNPGVAVNQPDDMAPSESPASVSTAMNTPRATPSNVVRRPAEKTSMSASTKSKIPAKPRKRLSKEFLTLSLCVISGFIAVILYFWWKHAGKYMLGKV